MDRKTRVHRLFPELPVFEAAVRDDPEVLGQAAVLYTLLAQLRGRHSYGFRYVEQLLSPAEVALLTAAGAGGAHPRSGAPRRPRVVDVDPPRLGRGRANSGRAAGDHDP